MRIVIIFIFSGLLFGACNKETYQTEPRITYLSLSPQSWSYCNNCTGPMLKFQLTDLEGDFGFQDNHISYVYFRNVADTINPVDSIAFPNLNIAYRKRLNVEVSVDLRSALPGPGNSGDTSTVFFEVYVKDFADHKSNVIRSTDPLYLITP